MATLTDCIYSLGQAMIILHNPQFPVSDALLPIKQSRVYSGTLWTSSFYATIHNHSPLCNTYSTLSNQSSVSRIKLELVAAPHQLPDFSRRSAHTTLIHRDTRQRRPRHLLQQTKTSEELRVDVHDLQDADRPNGKRLFGDEDSRSIKPNDLAGVDIDNCSIYSRQNISDSFRVPQGKAGNQLADSIRV